MDLVFYLSQYNFTIKYAAGKDNVEADSLSRDQIINDQRSNQDAIMTSKNIIRKVNMSSKRVRNRPRIFVSCVFGSD